ncbi:YtxH domain-containing protein [Pseudochryseolinea flava]|uniref:YtxH domain-containing protein n=1 Tax=Pseudochryseolinea flava TaxID=2059302 RepID=A0A364Y4B3_9BACT|nr:YtxH domain-containing protein [Pseudochryseolinea flava]RAW01772.1 YtxH domain-containing protein [Pseudochryseolinea flava]
MNSTGKFILGVLGAAAAGTVVGLLIAPEKGSDTRKKLVESIGKLAIDAANVLQSGKQQLADASDVVSEEAEGLKNDAKQRVRNVQESFS